MRTAPAGPWAAALGGMQSRIRVEVRRCWLTPCIPSHTLSHLRHWMPLEAAKLSLPPMEMQWDNKNEEGTSYAQIQSPKGFLHNFFRKKNPVIIFPKLIFIISVFPFKNIQFSSKSTDLYIIIYLMISSSHPLNS